MLKGRVVFIKIENLEVGMIVSNYRKLCEILEVDVKGGRSKQNQVAWFEEYFSYIKEGNKFIITDISDKEVTPLNDKRGGANNVIDCPACQIDRCDWDSIGVYKITLDNKIYIGSTTKGFRNRYLTHTYKYNNTSAREMLDEGAIFEIVEVCNGMTETEIRQLEIKWIQHYEELYGCYIVNKRELKRNKVKRRLRNTTYKIVKSFNPETGIVTEQMKKYNKVISEKEYPIEDDLDLQHLLNKNGVRYKCGDIIK